MKLVEVELDQPQNSFADDNSFSAESEKRKADAIFYRVERSLLNLVRSNKVSRLNLRNMSIWLVDKLSDYYMRKRHGTSDRQQLDIPISDSFVSNGEAVECIIDYLGELSDNEVIQFSKEFLGWQ